MKRNILGIDTSRPVTVISLNGKTVAWESIRNQSQELLPKIDKLITSQKLKPEALTGVVVNLGPGSFTGLRVGITIANGFGYGLKIPVVGLSEFEIIKKLYPKVDWIILDAKRDELFVQHKSAQPELMSVEAFGQKLKKSERVYIDDYRLIKLLHDALKGVATIYIPNLSREEKMAAMLAVAKLPKRFSQVLPLYLRGANITQPKKR
ncbi:MAG: tRNA (adenosine(37)-N6)-threonylcarbamoyltransferase complex dimerization subunit type 1 TsaB [Patescibacteria group bacterium]|nr:tRNA (adenosine(37)-N6)-threonylcarbamoyltransferase complex dimerization subunit type 1 TsaB [Patescibacteria group bacterium]